jgi:hypothetical protein
MEQDSEEDRDCDSLTNGNDLLVIEEDPLVSFLEMTDIVSMISISTKVTNDSNELISS